MIHMRGDLFNTHAWTIGHGVNTKGVMGAGIAKKFKEKYPDNFKKYADACATQALKPGMSLGVVDNNNLVVNFASQREPGADATYEWLFESTLDGAMKARQLGQKTIAIPEIGCGIGGLVWYKAAAVLEAVETIVGRDFEWEVWHYA